LEDSVLVLALLLMALIPVVELVGRKLFGNGIPGATEYLRHLTLWLGFLGATLATRLDKHLKLGSNASMLPEPWRTGARLAASFFAVAVCAGLIGGGIQTVVAQAPPAPDWLKSVLPGFVLEWLEPFGLFEDFGSFLVAGWIPLWVAQVVMPIGCALMALRFIICASAGWRGRLLVASALPATVLMAVFLGNVSASLVGPGILVLVVMAFLGMPIFAVLGGAALLLFWGNGETAVAAILDNSYQIVASEVFPTIPLFTLAGFILSEGHASERLVRAFRAWFGWIPGGLAVAATVLCAFFTTFTGASGVTILALGGLLLPVLLKGGFKKGFSIGLLTATGSLGLLLPPSLVVILYGVVAHVPITDMFIAGIVPGTLLVVPIMGMCVWQGYKTGAGTTAFSWREATAALWLAKWEVAMPAIVLYLIFSGFCTLVQSAAVLVVYALLVEMVLYRDISLRAAFAMFVHCAALLGGVLIVLGVAMGLNVFMVDQQVPDAAAEWVAGSIHAKWVFLLALNGALLLVGCLMDIFSALVVIVPLLLPIADGFGVDRVHLGVIFLANLQLGYLTPPVGMNLFLASFRFERPLAEVARHALPFLLIMVVVVLLITYVPGLSVGVLSLFK
jgi:tripartite ATP-independent transporter DctM subunit